MYQQHLSLEKLKEMEQDRRCLRMGVETSTVVLKGLRQNEVTKALAKWALKSGTLPPARDSAPWTGQGMGDTWAPQDTENGQ